MRDNKGEVVRSRLDETTLRAIAQATRGAYYPLGPLGEGLGKVRLALETKTTTAGSTPPRKLGVDRFHLPVAAVAGLARGRILGWHPAPGQPGLTDR